jgi:hypothetical protein
VTGLRPLVRTTKKAPAGIRLAQPLP